MDSIVEAGIFLGLVFAFLLVMLICVIHVLWKTTKGQNFAEIPSFHGRDEQDEAEDLINFPGNEILKIHDILEAPGEVIGKSGYSTLYKAILMNESLIILRFLRPACSIPMKEIMPIVQQLGFIRDPNLVSLLAFYTGPGGEKLLVHPYFPCGTLFQFLQERKRETQTWDIIYRISLGITKGLDHLHTGYQKPIIHGNLKSNNVLLDSDFNPYLSDFGLHLLLNSTAGQEMLEISAKQGYKAPELMKMKDLNTACDIYSLGIIILEILIGKDAICQKSPCAQDLDLPASIRNVVFDCEGSDGFSPQILSHCNGQNGVTEEGLLQFFQLAMDCCSPFPSLRPDIKQIVRRLEEIGK